MLNFNMSLSVMSAHINRDFYSKYSLPYVNEIIPVFLSYVTCSSWTKMNMSYLYYWQPINLVTRDAFADLLNLRITNIKWFKVYSQILKFSVNIFQARVRFYVLQLLEFIVIGFDDVTLMM